MIKGAIFDIDGTLLDSMGIWEEVGSRYLKTLGIEAESNLSKILFAMSMEEAAVHLKEHYYIAKEEGEIKKGILEMIAYFYNEEVQLKPGVRFALEELQRRKIPMVLATSGDEKLALGALKRLGIEGYFLKIFTCTMLQTTKREPLIYEKAITFLDVPAHQVVVFEDILHGLVTAKQLGCMTVAVEDEASTEQKTQIIKVADYYIQDFLELHAILEANFI